ncbi:MAG: hypothetical protein ACJ8GW_03070, partial [Massilia sp.]
ALHASHQRFNLTILTVNTHEPEGHLSQRCGEQGYAGFEGVVQCTASDLGQFLDFVKTSGYLADTNVVVMGDHLARKNPVYDKLSEVPERTIFNLFVSSDLPRKNTDQIVHFDMLPTILEFSGFKVAGGRLGLGYSAFNTHVEKPSPTRFNEMEQMLMNRSDAYSHLWDAPPRLHQQPQHPGNAVDVVALRVP